MKKYLILTTLMMPLMLLGQATYNIESVITVVGVAELEVEPNIIVLGMSARETENSKKESSAVTMENNITQFLKSIGIKHDSFTVDKYNTSTKYGSSKFRSNKSYQITIDKVSLLDTVVVKCMEYGMDNVYVQRVEHSEADSLQNILLVKAVESAKNKAKVIAENMNVTLGKVSGVNERFETVKARGDYYNHTSNDYKLEEVVVVAYGTSNSRIGSTISAKKLAFSKTIIAKFEIVQ